MPYSIIKTPKHPVRIIVFKLYNFIGAKIEKPTQ